MERIHALTVAELRKSALSGKKIDGPIASGRGTAVGMTGDTLEAAG